MQVKRPKVVVIGAGFGGLSLARGLRRAAVDVVLIDRNNHHLFQPLLYQVATGALADSDIASPIRSLFARQRNVEVLMGEVTGIDPPSRTVSLRDVAAVSYDYLVLATGVVTSWYGHSDWAAHSIGLKNLKDAEALRLRLLGAFERAESCADPKRAARLMTFVVVGGGATGIELAASIRELARHALKRDFRRIHPDQARVVMFEGAPILLAGFPEKLRRYAQARLQRLGIEVNTGVHVEQVDADGVVAAGRRITTANVFWCAGMAATPAAQWLGTATGGRGTIQVGADCSIAAHPEIFAIGDVASFTGADGKALPGVAPVAKQQGRYVARVIRARVAGAPPPAPFRYQNQGSLAIIGRSSAVANFPHVKFTGVVAWLVWSCVHLLLLNGLRNRVLVYVQWISAWLFNSRGALLMTGTAGPSDANDGRS